MIQMSCQVVRLLRLGWTWKWCITNSLLNKGAKPQIKAIPVAVIKSYGAFEIKPIMSDAILRPIAPVYVNTKINMIRIPAGKKASWHGCLGWNL